jgi:hypothetical protein
MIMLDGDDQKMIKCSSLEKKKEKNKNKVDQGKYINRFLFC